MMAEKKERLYGFDNLKFVLIFLVVLGHFLEFSMEFDGSDLLRRIIYSFHMPAFIFLTGFFAKFRPKKIAFEYGFTYVLFQVLYLLFAFYVLEGEELVIQFSFPNWLLWYLLATIAYCLLIPLIDVSKLWQKIVIVLISVAAALYAGNDPYLGYGLSAARIVSFLPFFLLGFYCGKKKGVPLKNEKLWIRIAVGVLLTATVIGICFYLRARAELTVFSMYGSVSYENGRYTMCDRALLMLFALIWIAFLMTAVLPLVNRKIPVISDIGKNSFSVFLLHGFVVKYCTYYSFPFAFDSLLKVLGATVILVLLCGNPLTAWVFRNFLTGTWIERLLTKKK